MGLICCSSSGPGTCGERRLVVINNPAPTIGIGFRSGLARCTREPAPPWAQVGLGQTQPKKLNLIDEDCHALYVVLPHLRLSMWDYPQHGRHLETGLVRELSTMSHVQPLDC
jgi:hypothetical protein